MVSAGLFGTLLERPSSPISAGIPSDFARRAIMGLAMGGTAIVLIYSPPGKRSGAHMNPAVTTSFMALGKISLKDGLFYILFQFIGGLLGIYFIWALVGAPLAEPPVSMVSTRPGNWGIAVAFVAEFLISALLFFTVLIFSNHQRLSGLTGYAAGILLFLYISFETPLSGMSMNPARSFASAVPGALWTHLWVYFVAPPVGMLAGAWLYRRARVSKFIRCAKLIHSPKYPCIFCGYSPLRK